MALIPRSRRLTLLDRVILVLLLVVAAALFPLLGRGGPGERVVVEQDGRIVFQAPLTGERTVSLPGPLGDTRLAVRGGTVRILSSPCRHQICLGMGGIQARGELIACLPNHLLVRIEGGEGNRKEYDLLSR